MRHLALRIHTQEQLQRVLIRQPLLQTNHEPDPTTVARVHSIRVQPQEAAAAITATTTIHEEPPSLEELTRCTTDMETGEEMDEQQEDGDWLQMSATGELNLPNWT